MEISHNPNGLPREERYLLPASLSWSLFPMNFHYDKHSRHCKPSECTISLPLPTTASINITLSDGLSALFGLGIWLLQRSQEICDGKWEGMVIRSSDTNRKYFHTKFHTSSYGFQWSVIMMHPVGPPGRQIIPSYSLEHLCNSQGCVLEGNLVCF